MFPMTKMRSDTGNILRSERKLSERQRKMCRQYNAAEERRGKII